MPILTPKAVSVTQGDEGTWVPDGWEPVAGFVRDVGPGGATQLVVSVKAEHLLDLHVELIRVLAPPLGVLYRQVIDRRDPKPQGTPPRDLVALELPPERVIEAVRRHTDLVHHDARCEFWVRGALGDQVVVDTDGLIHCSPDDPAFRDVLLGNGLVEDVAETIADRDYVQHLFHAEADAHEDALIAELGLVPWREHRR